MREPAIQVKALSYAFGEKKVLDDMHLEIEQDKIYGLLGRNGAGKTTLLHLLSHQLIAQQGEIKLFGKDPRVDENILEQVCIVKETPFYAPHMKGKDIFKMYQDFYPAYDEVLQEQLVTLFELPVHKAYRKYSRGMRTLLMNIIGICSRAALTIFDEPTLGLDALNREQFYNCLLEAYAGFPRTIILSTHLIEEVERVLERVLILKEGKMVIDEEVETLKAQCCYITGTQEVLEGLEALKACKEKECFGKTKVYAYMGTFSERDEAYIKKMQIKIAPMGLQKAFVEVMGKGV